MTFSAFSKSADFSFKMDSFAANYMHKFLEFPIIFLSIYFLVGLITEGYILNIVRVTQGKGHVSEMHSISTTKFSRVRYTCSKEWFHFVLRSSVLLSRV